jgi:FOG: Ankyrin repeat
MGRGTVLHRASERGKVDLVRYLDGEGVDPSITDANGRTAIECTAMLNQRAIQELQKGKHLMCS